MLNIPQRFKDGQASSASFAYPLIQIKINEDDFIYISQYKGIFDGNVYEDLALSVGAINDSVDFGSKKFKINNINITLSNTGYGQRFTDKFANITFSGLETSIYYANKNCKTIDDCVLAFRGYVRDYSSDNNKVSLNINDYAQYILRDQTIPTRKTINPSKETVSANKNVPYPMAYGMKEKSKMLFSRPESEGIHSRIYADATYDPDIQIYGFRDTAKPLQVFRDDVYMDVYRVFQPVPNDLHINGYKYSVYNGLPQYEIENDDTIFVSKELADQGFTNMMPLKIQSKDQLQLVARRKPTGVQTSSEYGEGEGEITNLTYGSSEIKVAYQGPGNNYSVGRLSENSFEFPKQHNEGSVNLGYYKNILLSAVEQRAYEDSQYNDIHSSWGFDWVWDSGWTYYINECTRWSKELYSDNVDSEGVFEAVFYPGILGYATYGDLEPMDTDILNYLNLPDDVFDVKGIDINVWNATIPVYDDDGNQVGTSGHKRYPVTSTATANFNIEKYGISYIQDSADSYINTHPGAVPFNLTPNWELRVENTQITELHPGLTGLNTAAGGEFTNGTAPQMENDGMKYQALYALTFQRPGHSLIPSNNITLRMDEPIPSQYIKPGVFDWLDDGEEPTLRKLLWGRRAKDEEIIAYQGINKGTWLYGLYPIIGACAPKSDGGRELYNEDYRLRFFYDIFCDGMQAWGNPMKYGFAWMSGNEWINQSEDYKLENVQSYYNDLDLRSLARIRLEDFIADDPNNPNNDPFAFTIGQYKATGSDFGPIVKKIYPLPHGKGGEDEPMRFGAKLEAIGSIATGSGNNVGYSYSNEFMQAAKLDITFNSLSADEVVIGSNYPKLKIKAEVEMTVKDAASNNDLHFLVEADSFRKDGERDNLIKMPLTGAALGDIDNDGNLSGNIYKLSTGNRAYQQGQEALGASFEYRYSSGDLETTSGVRDTIFAECDASPTPWEEEEAATQDPPGELVNTWRENVNNVNSVSVYVKVDKDVAGSDFNESGEFEGTPSTDIADCYANIKLSNIELVQSFISGNMTQFDYYGNIGGRVDEWVEDESIEQEYDDNENQTTELGRGKYSGRELELNSASREDWVLRNPSDILLHILDKEANYPMSDKGVDEESLSIHRDVYSDWVFDFTLFEETKIRDFIEDFSKSCMFIPKFKNDGSFGIVTIKPRYEDSDMVINSRDVVSFKYSKTNRSKLYLSVRVNYGWDDGLQQYTQSTNESGEGIAPFNSQEILDSYKIDSIKEVYLDFNSKFITSSNTARRLQQLLLNFHKNLHNVITCKLTHKYIGLECGDIVEFDSLIQDTKMFGMDYTQDNSVFNQTVYRYFIVESVKKSVSGVDVKLLQLHDLLDTNYGNTEYASDASEGITFNYGGGDVNFDGAVNVLDVVDIINTTVGSQSFTSEQIAEGDVNADSLLNILDAIIILNNIVGE